MGQQCAEPCFCFLFHISVIYPNLTFSLDTITCPLSLLDLRIRWKVHSNTVLSKSLEWSEGTGSALYHIGCLPGVTIVLVDLLLQMYLCLQNVSLASSELQHLMTGVSHALPTLRAWTPGLCFVPACVAFTGHLMIPLLDRAQVTSPLNILWENWIVQMYKYLLSIS